MENKNLARAVAIGADFIRLSILAENAQQAIYKLLNEPGLDVISEDRERLGVAMDMCKHLKYNNSIHRAIEYAEKELK